MKAQEQIEHISTSNNKADRLPILKAVREGPVTQSTLADHIGVSRKTVQRFFQDLDDCLFDERPGGYQLNGAGAIALETFETTRNQLGQEMLYSLSHSPSERVCLRMLSSQAMDRAEIVSMADISRNTAERLTRTFSKDRYVTSTEDGKYALSVAGEYMITAYDKLVQSFEQIFSKAVCLQCLDVGVDTLPAYALADNSKLFVTRPGQSVATRRKFLQFVQEMNKDTIDHLRVFTSFSNVALNEVFTQFVQAGTELDLIAPVNQIQGYAAMDAEVLANLRGLVESANTSYWLYRGSLPCNLVVFDHDVANIVPPAPPNLTPPYGDIRSSNPTIVNWAVTLFDEYLADAIRADFILPRMQQMKDNDLVNPLYERYDISE
jgi:predicted transcriptional regulator/biotin operon repressor